MKRIFAITISLAGLFFGGCGQEAVRYMDTDIAMGTVIHQNIYSVTEDETATEEILVLIRTLEHETLSRRLEESEVCRINRYFGADSGQDGQSLQISEEMGLVLENCLRVWESSRGAFDVTLAPVIAIWDIDGWAGGTREGTFEAPKQQEIEQALEYCGSGGIELRELPTGYEIRLPKGMELDMGAVGKGIALDEIESWLMQRENITGAVISVGGSILVYGSKPDKSRFKVAITNPSDTASTIGYLSLEGTWCISTSGDYERYVEIDGVRYHHIIDPATGYPADSGVRSVTILSDRGFLSDALSTACFVLGVDEGMKLAEEYDAEVLFVDKEGNIIMSEGMKKYFMPNAAE